MHRLATHLRSRDDNGEVKLVDAAYWVKGCSSLGRSRYAVLLHVDGSRRCCFAGSPLLEEPDARARTSSHLLPQKRRIFRHDHQPPQSGRPRAALQDRW